MTAKNSNPLNWPCSGEFGGFVLVHRERCMVLVTKYAASGPPLESTV